MLIAMIVQIVADETSREKSVVSFTGYLTAMIFSGALLYWMWNIERPRRESFEKTKLLEENASMPNPIVGAKLG
jgi:hypothetical protein